MERKTRQNKPKKDGPQASQAATISGLPGVPPVILGLAMIIFPITMVATVVTSCRSFDCSIGSLSDRVLQYVREGVPKEALLGLWDFVPGRIAVSVYVLWMVFQALMFVYLPGPLCFGQTTPSGNRLDYICNGWRSWIISLLFMPVLAYSGIISSTLVYDLWLQLYVLANVAGLLLTMAVYFKALWRPTHYDDRRFSGSTVYDIFMGIEHNPRLGRLDFKLFFNGRPGIGAWALINLSFAAAQYHRWGTVTDSMIIVNVLQALYIGDFFWNEDWYLRTVDIAHDHFGFYLAWGDLAWLPFMYTIQGYFLVDHPVDLPPYRMWICIVLGLVGYIIFRCSNNEKEAFRQAMTSGKQYKVWGCKPAEYIEASYTTSDGKKHKSFLLCSGWWGICRHANYLGDLMMSLAMCLACGNSHLLPYFYIVYMVILLGHRLYRDDIRCSEKYGENWKEYCRRVPSLIIPGLL